MLIYHQRLVRVGLFGDAVLREAIPISTSRKLAILL
jgi:hypothetical protein